MRTNEKGIERLGELMMVIEKGSIEKRMMRIEKGLKEPLQLPNAATASSPSHRRRSRSSGASARCRTSRNLVAAWPATTTTENGLHSRRDWASE